jgi:hypothetical protein
MTKDDGGVAPSDNDGLVRTVTAYDGNVYALYPHVFWYLAPDRTQYQVGEAGVRPLDFALMLHNAALGQGVVPSMEVLLAGITPDTLRTGAAREAELTLERIRATEFPSRPSRFRCHFLSYCEEVAVRRQQTMFRTPARRLARCQLLGAGQVHFADVELCERLQGQPDDEGLARRYWAQFAPTSMAEFERLEVLTSTALYFPDWASFPTLDVASLVAWQGVQPPRPPAAKG